MAPHSQQEINYATIQRVQALETDMKIVKENQSDASKEIREQTKHIYYGLGALGALLIVAELAIAYIKK